GGQCVCARRQRRDRRERLAVHYRVGITHVGAGPVDAREKQEMLGMGRELTGGLASGRQLGTRERSGSRGEEPRRNDAAGGADEQAENRLLVGRPGGALGKALQERQRKGRARGAPQERAPVHAADRQPTRPGHGVPSARNRNAGSLTKAITVSFRDSSRLTTESRSSSGRSPSTKSR